MTNLKNECGNCRLYLDDWDKLQIGSKSGYGFCVLNPEHVRTTDGRVCGQHRPIAKDQANDHIS